MKKPKLDREVKNRLNILATSSAVGADIKAILEHVDKFENFFLIQQKLLDWTSSCANISGKKLKEKRRQIERGIKRYEKQAIEFCVRSLRGEFDDYPKGNK